MDTRFLKVKIKSLCAEARIIRFEELKTRGEIRFLLRAHRVSDVRKESRATLVAYNFLRGKTLAETEPKALPMSSFDAEKHWKRVEAMVKKYGTAQALKELEAWRGESKISAAA
jgi:hypothetical protein